jgi:hypothetical protein
MAVTLGALADRIQIETNQDGTEFRDGIKRAIVTAIKFMEAKFVWLFYKTSTVTILAGGNAVDLPDDFARLVDVKFAIGTVLYGKNQGFIGVPFPDLNGYFSNTDTTGIPLKYSIYGNQLYIYPLTDSDIDFTVNYNYKDSFYPADDADSSIWFNDETVDCVRYKAEEIFYRDMLQSLEMSLPYQAAFKEWEANLIEKNTNRQIFNELSI